MSTILEALAVIKGKDATGGAFDAVANKIGRLSRAAQALNRDVQKQLATAQHAEIAVSRLGRASNAIGNGAKVAAGAAAAYEGSKIVAAVARGAVKAGSDRGHEKTRMEVSGMTEAQIKESGELASEMSAKYKSLSETEILHTARNVRSVVGSFEEATHVLEPLMKLRVVAQGAHPEKWAELGEDFDKLIKGMEIKGATQNLAMFTHYIDGMAKALNVFGDTLRPTDYYEMFKYGRAATNALSDEFILKTAPTLAQELGGKGTGDALQSFYQTVVGGKMKQVAAKEFVRMGLVPADKIEQTTTGSVKGIKPGGMKESRLAASDPYQWVNQVLMPALAAHGITDPQHVQEEIAAMFGNRVAEQLVTILANQRSRIEKDKLLVEKAQGIEAADKFQKSDPKVARIAIDKQADNLLGNTVYPFVPMATDGMNWLSSGLAYWAAEAKKNPLRSASNIATGTALIGALGLDGASSTLGVAGNLFRGEGALGGLRFGLTKFVAGVLAPIMDIASRPDILEPARFRKFGVLNADKFDTLHDIDRDDAAIDRTDFGDGSEKFVADLRAKNAARRAAAEVRLTELGYAAPGVPGRGLMAGQFSIDDVRAATGIGGGKEPTKAEIIGNATLETTVTVSPSADFLAKVEQKVTNAINAFRSSGSPASGTSGSTGRSMPEAGPAQ